MDRRLPITGLFRHPVVGLLVGLSLGFGGAVAVAGAELATASASDSTWLGCVSDTSRLRSDMHDTSP